MATPPTALITIFISVLRFSLPPAIAEPPGSDVIIAVAKGLSITRPPSRFLKKPQPELKSEKSKVKSAEYGGVCSNFFLCTFTFSLQPAFFSSLLARSGRERLRLSRAEDKRIRGEASALVRAGGARLRQGYGGSAVARQSGCE